MNKLPPRKHVARHGAGPFTIRPSTSPLLRGRDRFDVVDATGSMVDGPFETADKAQRRADRLTDRFGGTDR